MGENTADVRDSTLSALRISCPSAEVLDSSYTPSPMENPFNEADTEWSDEEELLPKDRQKSLYVGPRQQATVTRDTLTVPGDELGNSSSGENTPSRSPALSLNGSPLIPPKSPSRPDIRPGSRQEDLVERFYQVTRERDALRKELHRRSTRDGVSRSSIIYKSEEKTLIEDLLALRHEIREWSEEFFSGVPSARQKRPHVFSSKELFGTFTDNYPAYLKHPQHRPLLIQAYLWGKLQGRIFNNFLKGCGYVWAGKLGNRKLRPINDTIRKAVTNNEEAEDYHRWRATTVNLLVPQVDGKWRPTFDAGPVLKWISKFCSRIRRKLRPWATQSLRLGKEQLRTIVSAAVALDLKMKRQRADYRFITFNGGKKGQQYGYGFYDSEMEDIEEDDDRPRRVELALAPALERCGNANGYVLDQSFILVKADVSCKRVERKSKSSGSSRKQGPRMGVRQSVRNLWNN